MMRHSDIEREVVMNTFYNIGLRLSEREYHIDEFVIRHDIWKFLNNRLQKQGYYAFKEGKDKNDIYIKKHNDKSPEAIYEIKTGLKPNGINLDINGIYKDILKLAEIKKNNKAKKVFLILIGRTNKVVQGLQESKLYFKFKYALRNKKFNNYTKSFELVEKQLPTGKEINVHGMKKVDHYIKLRYSNCHSDYNVMVVSFEILSYKPK